MKAIMDQSYQDEIDRLKGVIDAQAEIVSKQEAVIRRQLDALEEMVRLREMIDGKDRRIRELEVRLNPWRRLKERLRKIPGVRRLLGN